MDTDFWSQWLCYLAGECSTAVVPNQAGCGGIDPLFNSFCD